MIQPEHGRLSWHETVQEASKDWEMAYGNTGLHWNEVKEAYLFGWEAAQRPEFAGKDWDAAEEDLAEHWFRPQLATEEFSWDYIKVAVSEGWRKAKQQLHASEP